MGPLERMKEQCAIVDDINAVLSQYGIGFRAGPTDITISDRVVSDGIIPGTPLSEAIIEHIWPRIRSETVFHYTTAERAQSMLAGNSIRLYCLLKRFSENEVEHFCKVHGRTGYLYEKGGVPEYQRLIMPNTFYASFTSSSLDDEEERYFWTSFGKDSGARLTIRITASNPNFRRITYGASDPKPIGVLQDLTETLLNKYHRHFVLAGISRMSAFYLPSKYGKEFERRAAFRVWPGCEVAVDSDGTHDYIEVPFGVAHATGFQFELVDVQSSEQLSVPTGVTLTPRPS